MNPITVACGVLVFVGMVLVAALYYDANATIDNHQVNVSCIDGIEYWTRMIGYKGFMAVRVDPDTMSFVTCDN
jgi:cbb3-type cytochrome oxidase subunit 1